MRYLLTLGMLLAGSGAQAATESYRLAFSKAENVEVFVDHAAGKPWCSPHLSLRLDFSGTVKPGAVDRLLPKLGSLITNQCPAAATLEWQSRDKTHQPMDKGTASSEQTWQPVYARQSSEKTQESVTTAQPALAGPDQKTMTAPAAQTQPRPQAQSPEPVAPQPEQTQITAAIQPAKSQAMSESVDIGNKVPDTSPVPDATAGFSVSGWRPEPEKHIFEKAEFLAELIDQQNCRLRVWFGNNRLDIQNASVESKGLRCVDGYLEGKGDARVLRSDGATYVRFQGHFLKGMPVGNMAGQAIVAGFDNHKHLLFMLKSDPLNRIHYLTRAKASGNGGWNLTDDMIALTENAELFRKADSIELAVMGPLPEMKKIMPNNAPFEFIAVRNLGALNEYDRKDWLYHVSVIRNWRTKVYAFNPDHAQNYMLDNERRMAEIARRKAEQEAIQKRYEQQQQANEAESQLAYYESLKKQINEPQVALARLVEDIDFGSEYAALMRGDTGRISQIVHVNGAEADDGVQIDFPYEARLFASSPVEDGWYHVVGFVRLDKELLDEQELPLTLINAETVKRCEKDGCLDLADPLSMMRQRLNDPAWTPESAMEKVRLVWPDRYPQTRT